MAVSFEFGGQFIMLNQVIELNVNHSDGKCHKATLVTYILGSSEFLNQGKKRPAVLICPGGGYTRTSTREAEPIAMQMNAMGFHAFVLYYSCAPATFPIPQLQASKALATIRQQAKEWNIDEDKVVICGFSAGGHLAASIGTFWNQEFLCQPLGVEPEQIKPNGLLLGYPVITSGEFAHRGSFVNLLGERYEELLEKVSLEKQVTENTPRTFIWHTFEDNSVPVENTLLFVQALRRYHINTEVHIYPRGRHGISLANEETQSKEGENTIILEAQNWITMAGRWIRSL